MMLKFGFTMKNALTKNESQWSIWSQTDKYWDSSPFDNLFIHILPDMKMKVCFLVFCFFHFPCSLTLDSTQWKVSCYCCWRSTFYNLVAMPSFSRLSTLFKCLMISIWAQDVECSQWGKTKQNKPQCRIHETLPCWREGTVEEGLQDPSPQCCSSIASLPVASSSLLHYQWSLATGKREREEEKRYKKEREYRE